MFTNANAPPGRSQRGVQMSVRTENWLEVYIDQQRSGNGVNVLLVRVRDLFRRFFDRGRWLDFASPQAINQVRKHGNEAHVPYVRRRLIELSQELISPGAVAAFFLLASRCV